MKRYLIYIGLLLLGIEVVRRLFSAATCYVGYSNEPVLILQDRVAVKNYCVRKHLLFPFYL
jgi:hypothetical protein